MPKIGAMSFCLVNLLEKGEQTPENVLRVAAARGLDGVEFYEREWGGDPGELDRAEELRSLAASLGVEIFAIGSGTRVGFHDERRSRALETLRTQIRIAAAVGAQVVTFPAIDSQPVPPGRDPGDGGLAFSRGVGPLVEQIQELAEFAGELSVRLAILNHCFFVSSSWNQEWAIKLAAAENVGACLDPGNYLFYECEDPVAAAKRLAGTVMNVRLGDLTRRDDQEVVEEFGREGRLAIYRPAIFGEGEVDHRRCLRILRERGYDGFVSLKNAGHSPQGPADAFARSVAGIRTLVEALNA